MPLPRTTSVVDISKAFNIGAGHAPSLFGQTINDVTPLMGGTADSGCLVLVSIGGAVFGATASDAGEWSLDTSIDVPLSGRFDLGGDGCKKLVVTAVDAFGRNRAIRGEFTILTASPQVPTLATVRVFRHSPLLDGHAEPYSQVAINLGGAIFVVTATSGGAWSVDTAFQSAVSGRLELGADGHKQVGMVCTDIAGNVSKGNDSLLLDTSANMAHLAVTPVPGASYVATSFPLFAEVGRAWRAAVEARRNGMQQSHRN